MLSPNFFTELCEKIPDARKELLRVFGSQHAFGHPCFRRLMEGTASDACAYIEYRKNDVINKYLRTSPSMEQSPYMLQIGYMDPDGKVRKNRKHAVFGCWEHGLNFAATRMFFDPSSKPFSRDTPLMILEVPWRGPRKLYVDWDLNTALVDGMDVRELRCMAMKLPMQLCQIMLETGIILADDHVRVFFKEGTRKLNDGEGHYKVSFHFIFYIVGMPDQIKSAWDAILRHIREKYPVVYRIIHFPPGDALKKLDAQNLPPMYSLAGIDLAGIRNACQVSVSCL